MKIDLNGITKIYKSANMQTTAVADVNLSMAEGDKIIIIGESGAGKSTLLNIIGCIERDYEGKYCLDGTEVRTLKRKKKAQIMNEVFGFVFQEYALVEDDTVYENVKIPLLYGKVRKSDYRARVKEVLEKVQLEQYIDKKVSEMSGGQRQRVAIARALVNRPSIILADEPTGALDKKTAEEVMDILYEYADEKRILVIVTHDLQRVKREGAKVIKMEHGKIQG